MERRFQAWNLNPANLALPVVNFLHNTPGKDDFYNVEFSATKRMSNQWSLNASFAYRWNRDNSTGYFGNTLRGRQDVANPNDAINTDNGQFVFGLWSARSTAATTRPWGLKVTPALRLQSGQPLRAPTFQCHDELRLPALSGRAHRLAPARTTSSSLDTRVEKVFKVAKGKTMSAFIDGYNLTNTNAAPEHQLGLGREFSCSRRRSSRRGCCASA